MRWGLDLSDGLRAGLFGGALPVSLLFSHNFSYTQPSLILISYSGSYRHPTQAYTVCQATVVVHGLRDLILVTNFWSQLWGRITGEFALSG
jgi:hypothetical protein